MSERAPESIKARKKRSSMNVHGAQVLEKFNAKLWLNDELYEGHWW
jgi:hypothetical protein